MPRYTEQEDLSEGMDIFFGLVFDKIESGRMSVQEAGRFFPASRHFEDEADFDIWDAYTSLDDELMLLDDTLNDPNRHWDDVQERMTLRKKPKHKRM